MNWHLIVFVAVAILLIYGIPKVWPFGEKEAAMPEFWNIKMSGGPLDLHIERIPKEKDGEAPHFFIAPYPPEFDEEGNPPRENIVGWMRGALYIRPNYAYYQQVTEEDYLYVRDLGEEEVVKCQKTGRPPQVQLPEEDGDE